MKAPSIRYAIVGLSLAALLTAPSLRADEVDAFVEKEMQRQHIPGLSIAVVRDGKVVKAKGYGLANVELDVPATADTVYQSGSVGKQFTATAVMMLVEAGKLRLDDKVRQHLPTAPERWKDMTIRHLLTHTAGIKNYDDNDLDYRKDYTEDELLRLAGSFPLDFEPGTKWRYSNTGYVVLGILIGKVTGRFYGDFLKERIFDPLGMETARIISEADIVRNRAAGYRLDKKGQLKNQEYVSPSLNTTADGSLYLMVRDLARWDAALYTEKLLKRSSLEQMWTPVKLADGKTHPYGFGWGLDEVNGHKVIEHGGAWQGFTSQISRYVDDKLTVIVLTNLAGSEPGRIAAGVAGLYVPALKPRELRPIEDRDPKVTERVKDVLDHLAEGTIGDGPFTAEMAKQLASQAKEIGTSLRKLGKRKGLELVEKKDQEEHRLFRYRAVFGETKVLVSVAVNKEGKIAALGVKPE
jgi:CubicO group peptidase (beta-lactamase class C family)